MEAPKRQTFIIIIFLLSLGHYYYYDCIIAYI